MCIFFCLEPRFSRLEDFQDCTIPSLDGVGFVNNFLHYTHYVHNPQTNISEFPEFFNVEKISMRNIALAVIFGLSLGFAQESTPEKLAVYVSGAGEAAINKSLGNKLILAMSQSGEYAEIADPGFFQDELSKSGKGDMPWIAQTAKKHGADYVCVVSMIEAFGTHSITARLIKISGYQVVKVGSTDRSLKSMEDLTAVSNELARQLLPPSAAVAIPPSASVPPIVFAVPQQDTVPQPEPALAVAPPPVAAQTQCERKYNINELLFKIKDGFPKQLKDCASTLAKDMLNPFGKKLEPKSFMLQCPIDGVKKELPDFPNTDKILGSLTNFVQGLLNSALAGGSLDPKKLVSAVGSMNIDELLGGVRKAADVPCVVDEPYEPPAAPAEVAKESDSGKDKADGGTSFGIRLGLNFSHTYAETPYKDGNYGDLGGMQAGFVLDFASSSWFHIQPGLMYAQKGMKDGDGDDIATHYVELPLLFSLKLAAFRLNAGPYFSLCIARRLVFKDDFDIGWSTGMGFDIGMFYIGAFYDYGFTDVSNVSGYNFYNRTLGFNLGINL